MTWFKVRARTVSRRNGARTVPGKPSRNRRVEPTAPPKTDLPTANFPEVQPQKCAAGRDAVSSFRRVPMAATRRIQGTSSFDIYSSGRVNGRVGSRR
jgi:hypothetical protein